MGKGDKRTKKGKIVLGSFGNSRPKKKNSKAADALRALKAEKAAVVVEEGKSEE